MFSGNFFIFGLKNSEKCYFLGMQPFQKSSEIIKGVIYSLCLPDILY